MTRRLLLRVALSVPAAFACGDPPATEAESTAFPRVGTGSPAPTPTSPPPIVVSRAPDKPIPPAPSCPPDALPADDACTISESRGVFVSSSRGSPDGDGTRASPLESLTDAIHLAKQTKRRVYACAETYRESIALDDGVSIFGYFDCSASSSSWYVAPDRAARISSPTSPAITAVDITTVTRVESVDAIAPDAVLFGASSIGMRATNAGALELVSVKLEAGNAAHGAHGVPGTQLVQLGAIDGLDAVPAISQLGCGIVFGAAGCIGRYGTSRAGGVSTCLGATDLDGGEGGAGGRPGVYERDPITGFVFATLQPEMGAPQIANSRTAQGAWPTTPAISGAEGAPGSDGASAMSTTGVLSPSGFLPASGIAGSNGAPGQGGGGGRAIAPAAVDNARWFGASGAGGGAGGCPGLAGTAGQGGGASIALLAVDSPMVIVRSELRSARGGDGGRGTLGSEPTPGGRGGKLTQSSSLTRGGNGGRGGRAGVSGNGAGGPSIAIAHHGPAPSLSATVLVHGAGGAGQDALHAVNRSVAASPAGAGLPTHAF